MVSVSSLPRVRPVAFSAFRAGSLVSVHLRSSSRSPSRRVLVCRFRSGPSASDFAARWAQRLGVSVFVRCVGFGGLWAVSIPVQFPSSRFPSRCIVPAAGGLRRFVLLLGASGFAQPALQPVAGEVARV